MKKIIYILTFIFLVSSVFALDLEDFPYHKEIIISDGVNEPVKLPLDSDVISKVNSDLSDLRVSDGTEVDYAIAKNKNLDTSQDAKILEASSSRVPYQNQNFNKENLLDGDQTTSYEANSENEGSAYFIVDLLSSKLSNSVTIWNKNSAYAWESIMVEGSNGLSNWKVLKKPTEISFSSSRTVLYPNSEYRYLRFTFFFEQSLVIDEIKIYGTGESEIVFFAESGKDYELYYGNRDATKPSYDTSNLQTTISTTVVSLGAESENPYFDFDKDNDGVRNDIDNCPTVSNSDQKNSDSDSFGDACDNCLREANQQQLDSDNDGVGNTCDNCIYNKNPDQLDNDIDGIGYVCDDQDSDGVINSRDNCVEVSNPDQSDKDRNGVGDACEDYDHDGVNDGVDNCLSFRNPDQKDTDKDGIGDSCDNCLLGKNPTQSDVDDDGIGDACEDKDGDGIEDYRDNCFEDANSDQADNDYDGLGNACDNCIDVPNKDQRDDDKDGIGYHCDDKDGDGIINTRDNCVDVKNEDQFDRDNDGIGYACEDNDNDGVLNFEDNCLNVYNPKTYKYDQRIQPDKDKDGEGDACDEDDNRFLENSKPLLWMILVLAVLILGYLTLRVSKKM